MPDGNWLKAFLYDVYDNWYCESFIVLQAIARGMDAVLNSECIQPAKQVDIDWMSVCRALAQQFTDT